MMECIEKKNPNLKNYRRTRTERASFQTRYGATTPSYTIEIFGIYFKNTQFNDLSIKFSKAKVMPPGIEPGLRAHEARAYTI